MEAPPALPPDSVVFINETSPEDNDLKKKDPFDPSPIDSGPEPDLYPPLAPVRATAAAAPSAEEILQTACEKVQQIFHMFHHCLIPRPAPLVAVKRKQ